MWWLIKIFARESKKYPFNYEALVEAKTAMAARKKFLKEQGATLKPNEYIKEITKYEPRARETHAPA